MLCSLLYEAHRVVSNAAKASATPRPGLGLPPVESSSSEDEVGLTFQCVTEMEEEEPDTSGVP